MSTTRTRIPLKTAIAEAEHFRALFDGCCDLWHFAGSIRRKKESIGDIEHVVIPRREERECGDLYGSHELVNLVRGRAEDLLSTHKCTLHNYSAIDGVNRHRFGDKYFGVDFRGRLHEVFMCEPDNLGLIFAIRTGSANFSRLLMGRLKASGFQSIGGRLFRQIGNSNELQFIASPDEADVFAAAGLRPEDWPPEKREVDFE